MVLCLPRNSGVQQNKAIHVVEETGDTDVFTGLQHFEQKRAIWVHFSDVLVWNVS